MGYTFHAYRIKLVEPVSVDSGLFAPGRFGYDTLIYSEILDKLSLDYKEEGDYYYFRPIGIPWARKMLSDLLTSNTIDESAFTRWDTLFQEMGSDPTIWLEAIP